MSTGRPWQGRRLHLIGIGGAGMSGYARCAMALGATVSGSDREESRALAALREIGVDARAGHDATNIPPGDDVEVFHSSAVTAENAERVGALARGLADRPRSALLEEFSALKRTIAVAGAHGKTTTTSMLAHALIAAGEDPSYLIGGELRSTGRNAAWGAGEWLVVEADESDRSMLALQTEIAVVTNIELDHHATYASLPELREVFREFLARAPQAVLPTAGEVTSLREAGAPFVTFELPDPRLNLAVPGDHNQLNAAAALAALSLAGIEEERGRELLGSFAGAGRRFETLGQAPGGARVVDDYAHHPTEVAAAIAAARTLAPDRVLAVFQPHLFSRTQHLATAFGEALATADAVVVLDVYPARERPEDFPGVTGALIADAATDAAPVIPVSFCRTFDEAEHAVSPMLTAGDLVLVMGAGDVRALAERLVSPRNSAVSAG